MWMCTTCLYGSKEAYETALAAGLVPPVYAQMQCSKCKKERTLCYELGDSQTAEASDDHQEALTQANDSKQSETTEAVTDPANSFDHIKT